MKGRKRHIVVDTLGLLLAVAVHPANIQDRDGAKLVLERLLGQYPRNGKAWRAKPGESKRTTGASNNVVAWRNAKCVRQRDSGITSACPSKPS